MLEELKKEVYEANMLLPAYDLVIFTWGNVSGIDREKGLMVIKPSGVEYEELTPEMMVVIDVNSGEVVEGDLNPSSDTDTHLVLYRNFKNIGGVVHTHSKWAVSFAAAGRSIPPMCGTHADHFHGEIPCAREMTPEEIGGRYEYETGKVIVETFRDKDPDEIPGILLTSHGPFSWGSDPFDAVNNAKVMETAAEVSFYAMMMGRDKPMQDELLDRHYYRKHGPDAYYGQNKK